MIRNGFGAVPVTGHCEGQCTTLMTCQHASVPNPTSSNKQKTGDHVALDELRYEY